MIDSHCHLDLPAFDVDRDEVLKRAQRQGISRNHIPGTTPTGWQKQQQISMHHDWVDCSFGLHPYFIGESWRADLSALEFLLESGSSSPIAIGEFGLDATISADFASQRAACSRQFSIANELNLPVILHHRKTQHELLNLIKLTRFDQGGILHAFSGSLDMAKRFVDQGFLLGIGGTITYERAQKTRTTIRALDVQYLVLETDAPDMPIFGKQGERNEPANLLAVCNALAALKMQAPEVIEAATTENYLRKFSRSFNTPRNK